MAQAPRKNTWTEQLWNVSLLPTPAAPRPVETASAPAPRDRGSALRTGALLSVASLASLASLVESPLSQAA